MTAGNGEALALGSGGTGGVRSYLRVKRRRDESAPSSIRLDGLLSSSLLAKGGVATAALQALSLNDETGSEKPSSEPSALLRRLDLWAKRPRASSNKRERARIIDAVLENDNETTTSKRRRLTLTEMTTITDPTVLSASSSKSRRGNRISVLNPVQRLVDDSLKALHQGEITPRQHTTFLQTDERLANSGSIGGIRGTTTSWWWTWTWKNELGNMLHACALWNDPSLAAELLQQDQLRLPAKAIQTLVHSVDGDGRTPYQVARLAGHTNVVEVMEAFGADVEPVDESLYVYDFYSLDDTTNPFANKNLAPATVTDSSAEEHQENDTIVASLAGGLGFWDEDGRLLLTMDAEAWFQENGGAIMDEEDNDDEDSNAEDWEGNDYPDEELVASNWIDDDEDEDLELEVKDSTFRYATANLNAPRLFREDKDDED